MLGGAKGGWVSKVGRIVPKPIRLLTVPPAPLPLVHAQRSMLKFFDAEINLILSETRYDGPTPSIPGYPVAVGMSARLAQVISNALNVLKVFLSTFMPTGLVRQTQDTVFFGCAHAGLSITKVSSRCVRFARFEGDSRSLQRASLLDQTVLSEVRGVFESIAEESSKFSRNHGEAPAFLSRFFRSLLRRLNGQLSRLGSPAPDRRDVAMISLDHMLPMQPNTINPDSLLVTNLLPDGAGIPDIDFPLFGDDMYWWVNVQRSPLRLLMILLPNL